MKSLRYWIILGAAISVATACEGGPDPMYETRVVGIDELEVSSVELTFTEVREIAVTEQAIWVLDRHSPYVTSISRGDEGSVLQYGHEGDGPSELRHPVALDPLEGGARVWDVQLGKRVHYAADGSLEAVERLSADRSGGVRSDMDRVSHLDPWRIRRVGDRWIYTLLPDGMDRPGEYGRGSLVAADGDLGSPSPLLTMADQMPLDERSAGQFPAMPLWDGCSSGFVVWNPRLARVEWRDTGGAVIGTRPVPSDGVAIRLGGIERFLQAMARLELGPGAPKVDVRARAREVRDVVGRVGTPFVDVRCGCDGRAWLRVFDLETDPLGAGSTWLVLGPDESATRVHFPPSFEPHAFAAGAVIGVVRTGEGERLATWSTIEQDS